jgi:hypothetical protein
MCYFSTGKCIYMFSTGNHNEVTQYSFFEKFFKHMDIHERDWRSRHLLLLDNCSVHKTTLVRKQLALARVPFMYTAPASYSGLPVE